MILFSINFHHVPPERKVARMGGAATWFIKAPLATLWRPHISLWRGMCFLSGASASSVVVFVVFLFAALARKSQILGLVAGDIKKLPSGDVPLQSVNPKKRRKLCPWRLVDAARRASQSQQSPPNLRKLGRSFARPWVTFTTSFRTLRSSFRGSLAGATLNQPSSLNRPSLLIEKMATTLSANKWDSMLHS